jgi:hypothetical protein
MCQVKSKRHTPQTLHGGTDRKGFDGRHGERVKRFSARKLNVVLTLLAKSLYFF